MHAVAGASPSTLLTAVVLLSATQVLPPQLVPPPPFAYDASEQLERKSCSRSRGCEGAGARGGGEGLGGGGSFAKGVALRSDLHPHRIRFDLTEEGREELIT